MKHPFLQMLLRWVVLALGVTIATKVVNGIAYDSIGTLVVVVLLLSLFNAVLRPVLVLFTLPFILLTLGFGLVLINALLFMLVGRLVEGFDVAGFWPALGGAVIVGLTNLLMNGLIGRPPNNGPHPGRRPSPPKDKGGDVIDI